MDKRRRQNNHRGWHSIPFLMSLSPVLTPSDCLWSTAMTPKCVWRAWDIYWLCPQTSSPFPTSPPKDLRRVMRIIFQGRSGPCPEYRSSKYGKQGPGYFKSSLPQYLDGSILSPACVWWKKVGGHYRQGRFCYCASINGLTGAWSAIFQAPRKTLLFTWALYLE